MDPSKSSRAQLSIRSFFQPKQPSHAAAPSQTSGQGPARPPPAGHIGSKKNPTPQPAEARAPVPAVSLSVLNGVLPVLPAPPWLPPQASIVPVTEKHIPALRRINSLLLPIAYPDSFYHRILDPAASGLFSRVILWQEAPSREPNVIGGLVCLIEPSPFASADANGHAPARVGAAAEHAIYIQSLALLSPYRSLGLATAALEHVLASAALLPATGSSLSIRSVYAHVWTQNDEALRWYEARGFRRGAEPLHGYYFKLRPDTAWIVRRDVGGGVPVGVIAAAAGVGSPAAPAELGAAWSRTGPLVSSTVAAAANLPPTPSRPVAPVAPTSASLSTKPSPAPTPPPPGASPSPAPSLSYQNVRPGTEWNDLPADMMGRNLQVPGAGGSGTRSPNGGGSGASSRSSSTTRKKKERAYPAAAFGS